MTREEAINEIKSWDFLEGKEIEAIHTLIPELRESEDERIREIITDSVFYLYGAGDEYKDVLDYLDKLEKQKEQKPDYADEYKKCLEDRDYFIKNHVKVEQKPAEIAPNQFDGITYGMQGYSTDKPAEWSEEDEKMLLSIIRDFAQGHKSSIGQEQWLKSLRPSWEPSEEQIYSLGTVVKGYDECTVGSVGYNLKELYEHLKKL